MRKFFFFILFLLILFSEKIFAQSPPYITSQPTSPVSYCRNIQAPIYIGASDWYGEIPLYRWYYRSTSNCPSCAVPLNNNSTYSGVTTNTLRINTGTLSAGTYYFYCVVSNNVGGISSQQVTFTVLATPNAPATTGASRCGNGSLTVNSSGGAAGQYRWYTTLTGGTAIAGQTNANFTTPVLNSTTNYYVAINNGICESLRTPVTATINTAPVAPTGTGVSRCGAGTVVLNAAGGSAGQYRWYTTPTGGTAIAGQTNSTYNTTTLNSTTQFYVALNNGICESARTNLTATINTLPNTPTTTGNQSCTPASLLISASGGSAGQYRWYTTATGGSPITGQTNANFTTPVLNTTTTYYVAINNGVCESTRSPVVATINHPSCSNLPPVIDEVPIVIQIGGIVTLDLESIISDPDNNLILSSLTIVSPPANAKSSFIDNNYNLIADYTDVAFTGIDSVAIRVCDIYTCVTKRLGINVVGTLNIYNAVSPNNDGQNDEFIIEHITLLSYTRENKVSIYSRWGDLVWEGSNYDNTNVVFKGLTNSGKELPSGTYFYKISFKDAQKSESGYLVLKR